MNLLRETLTESAVGLRDKFQLLWDERDYPTARAYVDQYDAFNVMRYIEEVESQYGFANHTHYSPYDEDEDEVAAEKPPEPAKRPLSNPAIAKIQRVGECGTDLPTVAFVWMTLHGESYFIQAMETHSLLREKYAIEFGFYADRWDQFAGKNRELEWTDFLLIGKHVAWVMDQEW